MVVLFSQFDFPSSGITNKTKFNQDKLAGPPGLITWSPSSKSFSFSEYSSTTKKRRVKKFY